MQKFPKSAGRITACLLAFCVFTAAIAPCASGAGAYDFWDVGFSWARPAVNYVLTKGYMSGVAATRFDPKGTVTRAQLAQVLYRMAGEPAVDTAQSPFEDVSPGAWYAAAAVWCGESGVAQGVREGKFAPNSPVTREQVCTMTMNFYGGYLHRDTELAPIEDMERYKDWQKVSPWAGDAVRWAWASGFMSGTSQTALSPLGRATREQLAQFLLNFDKNVLRLDIDPSAGEDMPYNIKTTPIGNKGRTKIIAHRGGGGIATENTLEAFTRAGAHTYYGMECDVQRTRDGYYVIFHDWDINRMTGDSGSIESHTFNELRRLQLYDTRFEWRVGGKNPRLQIPTLGEYLEVCKRYKKQAIIELKSDIGASDVVKIADIVRNAKYLGSTIFISFSLDQLLTLRSRLPNQTLLMNVGAASIAERNLPMLRANRIGCNFAYNAVDQGVVNRLHSAGLKVGCWTVNDPKIAQKLVGYGVDFITTDILE